MTSVDTAVDNKMWVNSGDSHFLEPDDLWRDNLPPHLVELAPRTEKDADGLWETVFIDDSRKCIGANMCQDRRQLGVFGCAINPASGRERLSF
jgi:hypothetical protein